jgi:hypothetical protein
LRFVDFLRATVMLSAGAATALAAVTVAGAAAEQNDTLVPLAAGWWVVAALIGSWLGRHNETNPPITRLLHGAKYSRDLPEPRPGLTLLNRLWPLLLATVGAGAMAVVAPQVPAVAVGFGIVWALAWRRQDGAVAAIEERDGVRFWVERTSPLEPMRLLRTPWYVAPPVPRSAGAGLGADD